jgi:hypothetical protein
VDFPGLFEVCFSLCKLVLVDVNKC